VMSLTSRVSSVRSRNYLMAEESYDLLELQRGCGRDHNMHQLYGHENIAI